jgi:hypothetical protein
VALQFLDDDTPNRWYRAADHYVRKHYGAKATMVRFKPHKKWGGYTFEVKPASQVPSWVKLPPSVLARKMPKTPKSESEKRAYTSHNPQHKATKNSRISGVLAGNLPDTFKSEPAKRIYTLHSVVSKAVYSSRIPGRVEPRVRTEELDSPIPEVRMAAYPLPGLYQRCLWLQNTPWNTICDLPFNQWKAALPVAGR